MTMSHGDKKHTHGGTEMRKMCTKTCPSEKGGTGRKREGAFMQREGSQITAKKDTYMKNRHGLGEKCLR